MPIAALKGRAVQTPTETIYRFGPFEVNAASGELSKQGKRVKLQEQPFRLLLILLENAGQVVTRAEIQSRIWDGNTFVDFDSSLRVAVRKLREALGDDAENPRYIETIPKRGYRFLEPAVRSAELTNRSDATEVSPAAEQGAAKSWRSRKWAYVLVIILLGAVGFGAFRFYFRTRTVLSEKDTVVLADFVNSTGDAVFDETLRQGMTVQLEQSPFLVLVSEERIQHMLRLMGRPADVRLTPELAREICERTGSAAVLEGSIARLGSQYVLGLHAKNCRTGDILDDEQAQATRKEDVLNALSQIAIKFRSRVGESLSTIQQHDTPLAEATTPSLEALEAYSMAWKVHSSSGATAALPLFRRATEIDPNFAMAHAALGRMYADLDESDLSAESTTRAWQLRDRTNDRERFFITAGYQTLVTGNLEKAQQTCEAWAQTYPREALPHTQLSGYINKAAGQYEKAAAEARKAIDLDPDFAFGYFNVAVNNVYLDRLGEAENALRRAAARGLEMDEFIMLKYDIDFLRGDQAGMEREAARARGRSGGESWISNKEG